MTDPCVAVLLVDDNELFRDSLREMLELDGRVEVAGVADDGEQALEMAGSLSPRVVLMDLSLPSMSGFEATRRIVDRYPQVGVVGLSAHDEREVEDRLRRAGARGYLRKDQSPDDMVATILAVAERDPG